MRQEEVILSSIEKVLIEKNKRYGNAALSPINVFYKGDATNSICIRLDDKVSRIKNSEILRKNDLFDLLGYLYLLCISNDIFNLKCEDFEGKVGFITETLSNFSFLSGEYHDNGEHPTIDKNSFENDFNNIKNNLCQMTLLTLMSDLVVYFKQNNITDFSDLID